MYLALLWSCLSLPFIIFPGTTCRYTNLFMTRYPRIIDNLELIGVTKSTLNNLSRFLCHYFSLVYGRERIDTNSVIYCTWTPYGWTRSVRYIHVAPGRSFTRARKRVRVLICKVITRFHYKYWPGKKKFNYKSYTHA